MPAPVLLADINPGENSSDPQDFVSAGSQVFFTAYTPEYGRELWRTDGTTEGTNLVKDIKTGSEGMYDLYDYAVLNNSIYFGANDGVSGFELWTSDGSAEGTSMVADLSPGSASSSIGNILATSEHVYFELDGSLWRIGVNQESPSLVKSKEMPPDSVWNPELGYTYPAGGFDLYAIIGATSDVVFLGAEHRTEGDSWENSYLWAYNTKDESLQPLKQVDQYYGAVVFRDKLFYGDGGLWVSDGSTDGTSLIRENVNPSQLTVAGNYLYFANGSKELWRTDGTGEGTALVKVLTGNESDGYGYFFQALVSRPGNRR